MDNSSIIWLGADSNDTIPKFPRHLQNHITFIDNRVDCTEYITSLSPLQYSIILIMFDEYTTYWKEIENMLTLSKIKLIYVIRDDSQLSPFMSSLDNQRLKYILNDPLNVLKQLCLDRDKCEESIQIKSSSSYCSTQKPVPKPRLSLQRKIEQSSSNQKGSVIVAY